MKKIIRELIKEELLKEGTFYYHPTFTPFDRAGPDPNDKRWIKISARSWEEAAKKLPAKAKAELDTKLKKYLKTNPDETLEDAMANTDGGLVSFTFMDQDTYDIEMDRGEKTPQIKSTSVKKRNPVIVVDFANRKNLPPEFEKYEKVAVLPKVFGLNGISILNFNPWMIPTTFESVGKTALETAKKFAEFLKKKYSNYGIEASVIE